MRSTENALAQELARHHIRPSHQRILLLRYLQEQSNHPTVDEIFRELKPAIPTLSKSTVYNTLQVFCSKQMARALTIEEREVRYDALPERHGHFKCSACQHVENVPVDFTKLSFSGLQDHEIRQEEVYFYGLCPKCRRKAKKEESQ